MAKKMRFSIAFKINIAVLFLITLTAVILSYTFIKSQIRTVREELVIRGDTLARNLAYNSELGVLAKDRDGLDKLLNGLKREKDVVHASIMDNSGIGISEFGRHGDRQESVYVAKSPIITRVIPESMGAEGVLVLPKEKLKEEKIGDAYIEISLESLNKTISDITQKTVVLTLGLIIFSYILTIIAFKLMMQPLSGLVEGTKRIASGDLNYKVEKFSNDELGDLAFSFNSMTENLKAANDKVEKRSKELEIANQELKEAQYKLVQSTKMAAIGQLGAGVAHELNNPLGGVLGYSQYIMQKIKKPGFTMEDFATCQTYLGYIEREALRCKTIVENLLKFSRGPKKETEQVDMNKVLKDTMPLTTHGLRTHKINIVENYDPELPLINGNFNKLQQVMINLIINAEQAMPEGGQLIVTTRTKLNPKDGPNAVIVEIEDTGCGIPEENLNKLFEPFFTTKQNSKGTGLGLAVTMDIIQEHRGEINVKSQVGRGTTFIITLPCEQHGQA